MVHLVGVVLYEILKGMEALEVVGVGGVMKGIERGGEGMEDEGNKGWMVFMRDIFRGTP